MPTFSGQNVFGDLIIGASDGGFTNTQEFIEDGDGNTLIVDGNEDVFFHVQVEVDFPSTPVDDCIISFYSTCDDAAEEFDISPFYEAIINRTDDPARKSYIIAGFYRWRIGVAATGGTDTIAGANVKIRGRTYK